MRRRMDLLRARAGVLSRASSQRGRGEGEGNRWRLHVCLLVATCLSLAACGSDPSTQSENYGNILASPSGLVLVQSEHQTGWGRADCYACHNVNNIHQINRTGLPDDEADLAGVRAIVQNQGEASCMMCHGTNGVEP